MTSGEAADAEDGPWPELGPVALARMVNRLNQFRSENDVLGAVLTEGVTLLSASSCVVHVLDDQAGELFMMGSIGIRSDMLVRDFGRLPLDAPLPAIDAMRTGEPVFVRSPDDCKERYPLLAEARSPVDPAFVVVPMYDSSGGPFGTIGFGFPSETELKRIDSEFLVDVVTHSGLALHRARLNTVAERIQEQLAFLDALSGALSRNLDVGAALTHLAELTVPRLADWCAVRVGDAAGSTATPAVGVAHRDPVKLDSLSHVAERILSETSSLSPLAEAFRTGQPFIRDRADVGAIASDLGFPDAAEALEHVGVEAVLVFPLQARSRLIGALAFGNMPGRILTQHDFDLAHAAAVRAAVLVDNARLFAERSEIARSLQDSLLPGVLPDVDGVELGARYRPAGQGLDVGGDFYDAFQADANWWVFAVGDVCGHGVEAASLTGLARHTIRSAAMSGVMPSAVLTHLNKMLLQHSAEIAAGYDDSVVLTPRFCTVLVGAVQKRDDGIDVILCSAGHPLPLVRRSNDKVEPVGVPGTLLGVTEDVLLTDVMVHLTAGEALVCYTDGVTDRRSGRRIFGDEGVVASLLQGRGASAYELAEMVERDSVAFVDGEPSDDMAVFVIRAVGD